MKLKQIYWLSVFLTVCGITLTPLDLAGGEIKGKVLTPSAQDGETVYLPIVWLEGVRNLNMPLGDTRITHISDRLDPPVSIGYVGNEFVLGNDDPRFHNTHLYLHLNYQKEASQRPLHYGATIYNIPLPNQGEEIRKRIKSYHRYREETGYIEVVCNPHPGEKAYILVFDHPYCDIAGEDGSFSIKGIPAGRYPLMAFHDGTIKKVTEVEVLEEHPIFININMK